MAYWGAVAAAAAEVGSQWLNASSQHKANRTNIQLQREQQKWSEMMANTAVQRRAKDIAAAGGNPATAFVNGGEASTPVIQPARTEATKFDPNFTTALMMRQQLDQMKATTQNISADTRQKNLETNIREAQADHEVKYGVLNKEATNRKLEAEIENLNLKKDLTAQQTNKLDRTIDSLVETLHNQAREGKLNVDALENIAEMGGIEMTKMQPIIKLLIDIFTRIAK